MRPRYLGPCVVVSHNRGGAYVLAEMNGAVFDRPIAAFRVLPYLARTEIIELPDGVLDATEDELRDMAAEDSQGDDETEEGIGTPDEHA